MTMPQTRYYTEAACNMLRRLRREVAGYRFKRKRFSRAVAILLVEKGEVLAHNMVLKDVNMPYMYLHAYTKKEHRQKGYQKRLLKYTSQHYRALYFWTDNKARTRTFAYYTGHRRVD